MREILFKAKRIDNEEWVEGAYLPKTNEIVVNVLDSDLDTPDSYIYEYYKTDPSTLCQYTGLIDKNEKRIWENDVLNVIYSDKKGDVHFAENCVIKDLRTTSIIGWLDYANEIEVTGNIFDNPELLEVRNEQSSISN